MEVSSTQDCAVLRIPKHGSVMWAMVHAKGRGLSGTLQGIIFSSEEKKGNRTLRYLRKPSD